VGYFTVSQIEAKIALYSAAIDALATAQSYSIDTGQSKQTVTRADITSLHKELDRWLAMYAEETDSDAQFVSMRFKR
jgi:hypothetical protein